MDYLRDKRQEKLWYEMTLYNNQENFTLGNPFKIKKLPLQIGNDWFLIDKSDANRVMLCLEGEPGLKIQDLKDDCPTIRVHLTHLPLLYPDGIPDSLLYAPYGELLENFTWINSLFEHQCDTSEWIRNRRGTLLCHGLGLGKTRTTIASANIPMLIVCPKTASSVWEDELTLYGYSHHLLTKAPKKISEIKQYFKNNPSDTYILNYHVAKHWLPYFCELGPTPNIHTLIADEAHYLQKASLSWSQALRRVKRERTILITATPIRNRLQSLWALLDAATPGAWGSHYEFRKFYCGAELGEWGLVDGYPSEEILQRLSMRLSVILNKHVPEGLVPIERKLVTTCQEIAYDTQLSLASTRALDHQLSWLSAMRLKFGLLKVDKAIDLIQGNLEEWGRAVVWIWHKEVLVELANKLDALNISYETLLGSTTQKKRDKIAREWKHGPVKPKKPKVLIAGIAAASTAISLTTCGLQIFLEHDWAPLQMQQSEARCYRYGQKHKKCLSMYIVVPGTIDEHIANVLLEKAKESEKVLGEDGQVKQIKTLLAHKEETDDEFIKRMAQKYVESYTSDCDGDYNYDFDY